LKCHFATLRSCAARLRCNGRNVWRDDITNNCLNLHHRGFWIQAHTAGVQTQPSRTCINGACQATWEKGHKPLSVTSSVEDSLEPTGKGRTCKNDEDDNSDRTSS